MCPRHNYRISKVMILYLLFFCIVTAEQTITFDKKLGSWSFGHETELTKGEVITFSSKEEFKGRKNLVRLTDTTITEPTYGINLHMNSTVAVSRDKDYLFTFDIKSSAERYPYPVIKIIQYDAHGKDVSRTHSIHKYLTFKISPRANEWESVQFPINGKSLNPATTQLKFVLFGLFEEKYPEVPNGTAVTCYDNIALTEISSAPEGTLLKNTKSATVWQSPAEQKVVSGALPSESAADGFVQLSAAKGETESIQLVITPENSRGTLLDISVTDLKNENGTSLKSNNFTIREVVYIPKNRVVSDIGSISAESFPDPLPLLNIPKEGLALADSTRPVLPLWISVSVPESAEAGEYTGEISLKISGKTEKIPVKVKVWDFALPRFPVFKSKFAIFDDLFNEFYNTPLPERGMPDLFYEKRRAGHRKHLDLLAANRMMPLSPFHTDSFSLSYEEKVQGRWQRVWEYMPRDIDPLKRQNGVFKIVDSITTGEPKGRVIAPLPVNGAEKISLNFTALLNSRDKEFMVFTYLFDKDMNPIVKPGGYGKSFSVSENNRWQKSAPFTLVPNNHTRDERAVIYISFVWYPTPWDGSKTGELNIDDITLTREVNGKRDTLYFENFERRSKPEYRALFDTTEYFWETARYAFDTLGIPIFRLELPDFLWLQGRDVTEKYRKIPFVEWNSREMKALVKAQLTTLKRELGSYWERAYIEWLDEPYSEMKNMVSEGMAVIDSAGTGIPKTLVIARDKNAFNSSNANYWTPLTSLYDKTWAEERLKDENSEMWWYVCSGPITPFANFHIDKQGVEHRVIFWQAFANQIEGLSYWCVNWYRTGNFQKDGSLSQSNRAEDNNPWSNPTSRISNGLMSNGDGRLIYLPRDTLSSDLVPSIRMELIRDGIEDIDMLTMLKTEKEKLDPDHPLVKRADECLDISKSLISYDRSPTALQKRRVRAAETLEMILKVNLSQK